VRVGLLPAMDSGPTCAKFSAAEFFRDSPWLHIPDARRGEILIQPLYPRGCLLGGSPTAGGPKVSKLAALAAARKKKENDTSGGSSSQKSTNSVALLDKLSGKTAAIKVSDESPASSKTTSSGTTALEQTKTSQDRKYPVRNLKSSSPSVQANISVNYLGASESTPTDSKSPVSPTPIPAASPSIFAKTIFGCSDGNQDMPVNLSELSNFFMPPEFASNTELDPFAGPSPDDIVIKAQNSKGSTQKLGEVYSI